MFTKDCILSISMLFYPPQTFSQTTHTNFTLWGVVGECSIEEIVSYVTEEYDAQAVTLAQINELQDGKTLAEI